MNKNLLDYIRNLSKNDSKTLSQKALKTAEECGELAKAVLPYDNAFATTHRFATPDHILEEAVDVILCSLSIAYDLDFSDQQIEDMFHKKSQKWNKLQLNENNIKYPIPFEIHTTIKLDRSVDEFKNDCKEFGIKALILENYTEDGNNFNDIMSSFVHYGTNRSAFEKSQEIIEQFKSKNYNILRNKIESVPWHPSSPKNESDQMPTDCYFEAHFDILINNLELINNIRNYVENLNLKLSISRNILKVMDSNQYKVIVTYRTNDSTLSKFQDKIDFYLNELNFLTKLYNDITIGKVHKEFSVYDSNISHDVNWIKQ